MQVIHDVIVAGAGASGVLLANRIRNQFPNIDILMIEKEKELGGRIRTTDVAESVFGYGLSGISEGLYEFIGQTLRSQAHDKEIQEFAKNQSSEIGVLAANKITRLEIEQMFEKKGARLVGGAAAARDWTHFDDLLSDFEDQEKLKTNIGKLWKGKRSSPSAIVLEHLARAIGIPNVWNTSGEAFLARMNNEKVRHFGDWSELFQSLLIKQDSEDDESQAQVLPLLSQSEIVDATFDEEQKHWKITTASGDKFCKMLVIAQSPWDAIRWLPKKEWPIELLNIVNKAKPVSVLSLTEKLKVKTEDLSLPEIIIVPAEDCQIIVSNNQTEVVFQATLDFELSVQAPAVVKAVKRLKRARKKLLKANEGIELEGDHLALQPVGWTQPLSSSERKLVKKLEKGNYNSNHLMFCGDSYGATFVGDENIIQSVLSACDMISNNLDSLQENECQPS